jgi:hypothetical protein
MSSIWKDPKSPYYQVDIWIDGRKLSRSTRCTREREARDAAERIEKQLRAERAGQEAQLAGQGTKLALLKLDYIAEQWMLDIGDHHRGEGPRINEFKIDRLIEYFGAERSLADITLDDVAKLINWRRQHRTDRGRKKNPDKKYRQAPLISAYTVNDTTEQLKKLFTYCKARNVKFEQEPNWSDPQLWLREPEERERYLSDDEADRLDDALEAASGTTTSRCSSSAEPLASASTNA